jgi:hypothetical protein
MELALARIQRKNVFVHPNPYAIPSSRNASLLIFYTCYHPLVMIQDDESLLKERNVEKFKRKAELTMFHKINPKDHMTRSCQLRVLKLYDVPCQPYGAPHAKKRRQDINSSVRLQRICIEERGSCLLQYTRKKNVWSLTCIDM